LCRKYQVYIVAIAGKFKLKHFEGNSKPTLSQFLPNQNRHKQNECGHHLVCFTQKCHKWRLVSEENRETTSPIESSMAIQTANQLHCRPFLELLKAVGKSTTHNPSLTTHSSPELNLLWKLSAWHTMYKCINLAYGETLREENLYQLMGLQR
jgi:hypothetical protein